MPSTQLTLKIPVEIWQNCWTADLHPSDLLALSTTCKLFHEICRPHLYETLNYIPISVLVDIPVPEESYKAWESGVCHFEGKLIWLSSDPVTIRYPRSCMFSGFSYEDLVHFGSRNPAATNLYHWLLSTFKKSLGSFTSLRSVNLEDIEVDEEIIQGFQKLPLLEDIYLRSVNISCRSTSTLLRPTILSIAEWTLQREATSRPLELFSIERLQSLAIRSRQYALPCLQHLASQGPCEALTTLNIFLYNGILPTLFAFLEVCPRLTTLQATVMHGAGHLRPEYPMLSTSALPNLHRYEGVASLAAVVVPGRPVDSVVLEDVWDASINHAAGSTILHYMAKSSIPMRGLSLIQLTPDPEIFHVLSKTFPQLDNLRLYFKMTEPDTIASRMVRSVIPDEDYLDVAKPTEIGSIPVNDNGCPIRPPTTLKGMLYWLCLNKLPLPPKVTTLKLIQVLGLEWDFDYTTCLTYREQYQILEKLSVHLPNLKDVTLGGFRTRWEIGDDGKWKPGTDYSFFLDNGRQPLESLLVL